MMNRGLNRTYIVGAYERLFREDDRKEESSSIESQKMIIESFAKFNNFAIYKHYSDDGYTGSNFNRPGFEELKRDIEEKKINCVIVKDLSRLGRELNLTGSYIEEYFLSKDVRFIAINDGYDFLVGDSMLVIYNKILFFLTLTIVMSNIVHKIIFFIIKVEDVLYEKRI